MKRHLLFTLLTAVAGVLPATAQEEKESFDAFREGLHRDFEAFRRRALDDYARYLDGVWQEYNAFRGEERDPQPKPPTPPIAEAETESGTEPPFMQQPRIPASPENPIPSPDLSLPSTPPAVMPDTRKHTFTFYSLSVSLPETEALPSLQEVTPEAFARYWRLLERRQIEKEILPHLYPVISTCGLNDWFSMQLLQTCVESLFADASADQRTALKHYLLTHMEYDVRLATGSGHALLLIAFHQKVYARSYIRLNDRNYYLFPDPKEEHPANASTSIHTCNIPGDIDTGRPLNLLIRQNLTMPFASHPYRFSDGVLTIEGEVNANIMQMLFRYPQMSIPCYAQSVIDTQVRETLVAQLAPQLQGLPQREAVDRLLHFVQHAFPYATDEEQHGFEKPYFMEEMLYYPQCDCEDRSVFYAYLLREVLQTENHLVSYPGHECVAVHLDEPMTGSGYLYDGRAFYISDPTYIGASTGQCMPAYREIRPTVEVY